MKIKPIVCGIAALALSACGGGTDSSPGQPSVQKQTVSGVAASGAAMQGATVTLVDATGKSVNCPADATTGAFQCDVTGLTAPFALSAVGNVADTQATLISVSATGGTQTINITPITNAIAATLADGNPTTLIGNSSLLQTKITAQAVTSTVQAYSAALANLLAATGNAGVDLISGPLTAGAPGLDKLLDQLKVNVLPDGGVQISSVAGVSGDTPVQLQLAHGVAPQASDAASLPAVATINGSPVSNLPTASDLSALQSAFNKCFAGSTGAMRTNSSIAACTQLIVDDVPSGSLNTNAASTYLNNGQDASHDFGAAGSTPGIAADDAMNNATFSLPEVIRVMVPAKQGDPYKMWIKLSWTRADGIRDGMQQIVQLAVKPSALTGADNGWRVIGNQREVLSRVTANAQKRTWLNPAKSPVGTNAFIDEMNLEVGTFDKVTNLPVDFAIVNGPGLRNGVFLQPSSGPCNTLNLQALVGSGQTAAQVKALYPNKESTCRNNYRMAGVAQDQANQGTFSWPTKSPWAQPMLTATELAAITPFSAYTIDVYEGGNATTPAHSYTVRLRTPSPTPDALRGYAWQDPSQATLDTMTPGTASTFAGGPTFPVSWISKVGLPFVKHVNAQIRATASGNPTVFVNGGARPAPVQPGAAASVNVPGDQGAVFPSVTGWSGAYDFSFISLAWTDAVDSLFTTSLEYDR